MKPIYLDYAATTPVHPQVISVMPPYFNEKFGNPSSIYSRGQEAKEAIEGVRKEIASFIGARVGEVVFTSGGSEADNFAIKGVAFANEDRGNHIITSAIEHHAVLETCRFLKGMGFDITFLPVDRYGLIDPAELRRAIIPKTILISIMHANNEVGTIEPISEIGRVAKEAGVYFHTDAVQTLGHLKVDVDELGVDLLSASAHKLYGPKGVGMLYVRRGVKIFPLIHGGEQEKGRRASTENVPGIIGFGEAVRIARKEMEEEAERVTMLRDRLVRGLFERISDIHLNGHPEIRLPNNVNISVDFVEGESMLLSLDMKGIAVSTGSACSSASQEPSHVLLALGLSPEQAHGSLRFSLGKWTTDEEIEYTLEVFPDIVSRLRALSPLARSRN